MRAGAAKWDHHWYSSGPHHRPRLASRVTFTAPSAWMCTHVWGSRVILMWMRLVRVRTVHKQRMQSDTWRQYLTDRRRAACGIAPQSHDACLTSGKTEKCHQDCPQCALQIKTEHNCTSGATAVHVRRGKRAVVCMSETVTRRNVRARVTISTDVNDDTGRKRKRHADAQLAYSAGTLHKLQKVVGVWYHTPQPFGDG